jgi:serine/threonine protein kinase
MPVLGYKRRQVKRMTDLRTLLPENYILRCRNSIGEQVEYVITGELGRGGSCITYEGYYLTNTGDRHFVRIKECYPFYLNLKRDRKYHLICPDHEKNEFNSTIKRMSDDFHVLTDIYYRDENYDSFVNTIDIYRANGTAYLVFSYGSSQTLKQRRPETLRSAFKITRACAYTIGLLHRAGYLYLDLKPENILVSYGQTERIELFDMDSLLRFPVRKSDHARRISYSDGFAPIELQMGQLKKLTPATDVYGIGALLFCLLFGRTPSAADCERDAEYDFTESLYPYSAYTKKSMAEIVYFFHNTLAAYYRDRYQDMDSVCEKLDDILTITPEDRWSSYLLRALNPDYLSRIQDISDLPDIEKCMAYLGVLFHKLGYGNEIPVFLLNKLPEEYIDDFIKKFDSTFFESFGIGDIREISKELKRENRISDLINLSERLLMDLIERDEHTTSDAFIFLMFETIIHLSIDREDEILYLSNHFLQAVGDSKPLQFVLVSDLMVTVYDKQDDFERSRSIIHTTERKINAYGDDYTKALFYYEKSGFYDDILNGDYHPTTPSHKKYQRSMVEAAAQGIEHARKASIDNGFLLCFLLFERSAFIIRYYQPGIAGSELPVSNKKFINDLETVQSDIDEADEIISLLPDENHILRCNSGLLHAWFFTVMQPDWERASFYITRLMSMISNIPQMVMDDIDGIIVPCADIALTWERADISEVILKVGINLCDQFSDTPFMQKKEELLDHLRDCEALS